MPRWRYAAAIVAGVVLVAAAPALAVGTWTLEAGQTRDGLTLSAVSCTSTGWCAAVGNEPDQSGAPSALYAESGSGSTWTVAPTSGPKPSDLTGVSCVAPNWCQAVGFTGGASETLLNERWNGQAWSRLASPVRRGSLMSVSCVSRSFCVAVGGQLYQGKFLVTLVERWNGNGWAVVASPTRSSGNSELDAVTCVSPTWCAAVGSYGFSYDSDRRIGAHTLVELWNGKTWRIVPSPNTSAPTVTLNAVDCVSSTWCMAGGYGETGALIEHWNGRAWTIMGHPSAQRPNQGAAVWGVSCVSRTACVAAGYDMPLAESWNGKVWSAMSNVEVSNSQAPPQFFSGVSCITATRCETVGDGTAIYTNG